MKTLAQSLVLMAAVGLAGCGGEYAPQNPLLALPLPTVVPCAPPQVMFETFEAGTPLLPAGYGAGATPVSSWDTTQSVSPSHSWKLVVNSTGWGAGMSISTNFGAMSSFGYKVINANCKTTMVFSLRSNTAITGFSVRFRQAGNAATFQDANWANTINVPGDNAWHQYSLPVSGFAEDGNSDAGCAPNCSGATLDMTQIQRTEFFFPGVLTGVNVFVDDIYFQ